MKKITLAIAIFFGYSIFVSAQKPKFKEVSKEELLKTECEYDPLADAEYLYHGCEIEFRYNEDLGRFQVIYQFHDRIKIYNDNALDQADRIITYYKGKNRSASEKVKGIEAYTFYLENGKVEEKKLDKDNIYEEEVNKFNIQKKFAMPAIQKGCVLEIKYKLISPHAFSIDEFYFQSKIPVKYTEFFCQVPEYFQYNYNFKGLADIKLEESSKTGAIRYRGESKSFTDRETTLESINYLVYNRKYFANNIPSISNEPYVYTMDNYKCALKLELLSTKYPNSPLVYYTKTWNSIAEILNQSGNFGGEISKDFTEFNDLITSTESLEAPEKIATIYNSVQANFTWNGYSDESTDKGIKKMIKDGSGNSAEINLLLVNLLQKAGLDAYPMVSRKSTSGFLNITNPSLSDLNYVIALVKIGDQNIYLDATDKNLKPNNLPYRALNLTGIIVTENSGEQISISNPNEGGESRVFDLKIENDKLAGTFKQINKGYSAYTERSKNKNEGDLINSYDSDNDIYSNVSVENFNNVSEKIKSNGDITIRNSIQELDDKIFIDLSIGQKDFSNPFKSADRNFAMFFNTRSSNIDLIKIEIPEGYQVETLPEKLIIATPDMMVKYLLGAKVNGNQIIITNRSSLNQVIIPPLYYTAVKDLYEQIEAKLKEKIVLTKM